MNLIALTNRNASARATLLLAVRVMLLSAIACLFVGSLLPSDFVPAHPFRDKALHFVGYAGIASLAMISIRHPQRQLISLVLLSVLGVALELGQTFVPGRAFELGDIVANSGGIFVAFQVHRLIW